MADAPVVSLPEHVRLVGPQSAEPHMPTVFYPGPAPVEPMTLDVWYVVPYDETDKASIWARAGRALIIAFIVVLVLLIAFHSRGRHKMRSLSRKLAQQDWTVYLMEGCGYCARQMKELGGYSRYVLVSAGPEHKVLGGDASLISLDVRKIPAFPFWYAVRGGQNRDSRVGYQSRAALEQMAHL
jgi:hypothetical protein